MYHQSSQGANKRLNNVDDTYHHHLQSQTEYENRQGQMSNGGSLYSEPHDRNRSYSQVSFTIGDSSDCDSCTTTSGSVVSRRNSRFAFREEDDEPDLTNDSGNDNDNDLVNGNGIDNPWRKYHFQLEGNGQTNGVLKRTKLQAGREMSDNENCNIGGGSNAGAGEQIISNNGNERRSGSEEIELLLSPTTSTGLMIPNHPSESLARLADVSSEDEGEDRNVLVTCSRTWGKWRILIACGIVQLFSALMVSLQAPFYPAEAEKKGSSATEYGFVFGVFELTVFLVAPFFGSRIHKWNPKLVFHIGIFTAAISSIVYGLLDQISVGKYFIAASAFVRTLEALGESAVVTATFIIVASAFPDSVASTFAIVETFYSLGLISGPIVGSVLYQFGGYPLPFLVVGGLLLATAVMSFVILPSPREISEFQKHDPVVISSYKSFRLLGIGGVAVSALCIVLGAMSISYLQATLEPHLRQFGISQLTTGAILVINGAVYTIGAPFWGLICDKVVQLKLISFCGIAVLICGFSLIGPVPVFYFEQKLWIISIGLTLQGLGLGAVLVSSFVSILQQSIRKGLPDTPSTYGFVSSLWTSMFSLGSFLGASLSGILYDALEFSNGTYSVIAFAFIMMGLLLIFMFISDTELESFEQSENEPLVNNSTAISNSFYSSNEPHNQTCREGNIRRMWTNDRNARRDSYGSITSA